MGMFSCKRLVVAYFLTYPVAHGWLRFSSVVANRRFDVDRQQSTMHRRSLASTQSFQDSHLGLDEQNYLFDTFAIQASLQSLGVNTSTQILSFDPLVYTVRNLLSKEECEHYRRYVQEQEDLGREMTRSNPPDVSLNVKKLWPLPLLSVLAGIPRSIRFLNAREESPLDLLDMFLAVSPSIFLSLLSMGVLAFLAVPLIRRISDGSARTSVAMALNLEQDLPMIRSFVDRATACVQLSEFTWQQWEAPVVTRYDVGAVFARHGDASPTLCSEWKEFGGQRLVTCICYLNTLNEKGGETSFDRLGITVSPEAGTALFFYPADAVSLLADERTTHESLPPAAEKWIAQMFGRAGRVPSPLGILDVFDLYPA
jgi:2OG-Fe(II) oxygenase superfamily